MAATEIKNDRDLTIDLTDYTPSSAKAREKAKACFCPLPVGFGALEAVGAIVRALGVGLSHIFETIMFLPSSESLTQLLPCHILCTTRCTCPTCPCPTCPCPCLCTQRAKHKSPVGRSRHSKSFRHPMVSTTCYEMVWKEGSSTSYAQNISM